MTRSTLVDIDVRFCGETRDGTAWGVWMLDQLSSDKPIWIDKDRCEIDPPDPSRGMSCVVTLDAELARRKGLIDD